MQLRDMDRVKALGFMDRETV